MALRQSAGAVNKHLKIYLYRNQLQLTTPDAFYSDGRRYRPAVEAANYLKPFLPGVKQVLTLGTGLGSIVRVLRSKGANPVFTLVENDQVVLNWAIEFMEEPVAGKIEPVCMDARVFMTRNSRKFDLIFIDVFSGRVVPDFVTGIEFLQQCSNSRSEKGRVALNYIINDRQQWEQTLANFSAVFPDHHVISIDINRILISK